MSHLAIRAERLSKRYRLGAAAPYGALRDSLAQVFRRPFLRRAPASERESIWALDDVSFDVVEGEIVGVVGRNGSGKSTLLKILSRITEPTSGVAEVRGRLGSLLEVGTGFHPELTGRENIFVNGAILGMRRVEILRKFDEIVAFAGVEPFIDTPVKQYSSGMQMRLAFSVAAHLEPHILLVDEVLAVGDLAFQKKCLGKMDDVTRAGRTVLFVSHQMNQIRRLCRTTMWLDSGKLRASGRTGVVLGEYERIATDVEDADLRSGRCFAGWTLEGGGHTMTDGLRPFALAISVRLAQPVSNGHFGVSVLDELDGVLAGWAFEPLDLPTGAQTLRVTIDALPLRAGSYRLTFALFTDGNNLNGGRLIEKWAASPELVIDTPPLGHSQDAWAGLVNVPATLRIADTRRNGWVRTLSSAPTPAEAMIAGSNG